MSFAYLDLNDSNLRLWLGDRVLESPGYALFDGEDYQFGSEARARARLRPRDVSTRYWWQLDTTPLQPALGPARHSADLVHAHLQHLHREAGGPDEWLLAAPGSMQKNQLALLLGIIQQCPFRAAGLVHRSVALASLFRADGPLFHLELQLHQALLTELRAGEGVVALQRETILPGCGLLQIQERLVETIARAFIRQTRFDPRRRAEPEQELYDALPAALEEMRSTSEVSLTIQGHRARISREELQGCYATLRDSVSAQLGSQGDQPPLLLDPLVGLLPGLQQQWQGLQLEPADLPAALAAQQERLAQSDEALVFVSQLPLLAERSLGELHHPPRSSRDDTASPEPAPTHLLQGHRARPLSNTLPLAAGWFLQQSGSDWQLQAEPGAAPLQHNGQTARAGTTLRCGDQLGTTDGNVLQLIAVGD